MKRTSLTLLALGLMTIFVASCKKDDTPPERQVEITDEIPMEFRGEHYTFYSFKEGKLIPLSDSATTKWDIGINFTYIILNSHASGPGNAGVIVKTGDYEGFSQAPETGYAYDTTATKLAIDGNMGSPNAWFIYQETNHRVIAKAGLFFVIKTADEKYAKMEINEATFAGWDPAVDQYPDSIIYKIKYVYQPDGSTDLSGK